MGRGGGGGGGYFFFKILFLNFLPKIILGRKKNVWLRLRDRPC